MAGQGSTSAANSRPLSPHLEIYRLPLVAILSITHRFTGIANTLGLAMLTCWLIAAASGPAPYEAVMDFFGSFIGIVMLFGWTLSIFYHLCNGIRHLVWDVGYGYELGAAYKSGYAVIGAAVVLTVLTWIVGIIVF
jgi:succinate dehydrogenase / fumarate reductase, cytochrome b subunit